MAACTTINADGHVIAPECTVRTAVPDAALGLPSRYLSVRMERSSLVADLRDLHLRRRLGEIPGPGSRSIAAIEEGLLSGGLIEPRQPRSQPATKSDRHGRV